MCLERNIGTKQENTLEKYSQHKSASKPHRPPNQKLRVNIFIKLQEKKKKPAFKKHLFPIWVDYSIKEASQVALVVKNPPANARNLQEMQVRSLGCEDPLERVMATYSSILAWRIPWTEEPDRLQSIALQKIRHSHREMLVKKGQTSSYKINKFWVSNVQ